MSALVATLLALTVLVAWLAAAGFLRLRDPLDRLHCTTFLNAGAGLGLIAASLAADGLSNRTGVIVLVLALNLLGGAVAAAAIGRALRMRGSLPDVD